VIVIKSSKIRNILRFSLPFAIIPAVVVLGSFAFDGKKHAFISLAVTALTLLLFLCGFEKRSAGSRRLVIASVITVLSVIGRFIPIFKPVTALTVIAAVYLGGETGFLVGALSALISNFYFGHGPWTAFQMLSWGLIGLFAGFLSPKLKKSRIFLLIYGAVSGAIFSLIMDVWSVLWYSGGLNPSLYLAAIVTALPFTALYSVSNMIFLWFLAKPFGDKLERIRVKYGL